MAHRYHRKYHLTDDIVVRTEKCWNYYHVNLEFCLEHNYKPPGVWHQCYSGSVPHVAPVLGGNDINGEPLYVGRAIQEGDCIPGKVSLNLASKTGIESRTPEISIEIMKLGTYKPSVWFKPWGLKLFEPCGLGWLKSYPSLYSLQRKQNVGFRSWMALYFEGAFVKG